MLELIEKIDQELFLTINGLNNGLADLIMQYASEKWIWLPFYLLILILIVRKYGSSSLYIILPVALVILATDQISVLIKNEISRYRPCHNLELMKLVHTVNNHCGGKYGFVSSHSANAFGLFAYLGLMLNKNFKNLIIILFFWACLQAYSRIYLGVHYPGDVIGGAIIGILLSFLIVKLLRITNSNFKLN